MVFRFFRLFSLGLNLFVFIYRYIELVVPELSGHHVRHVVAGVELAVQLAGHLGSAVHLHLDLHLPPVHLHLPEPRQVVAKRQQAGAHLHGDFDSSFGKTLRSQRTWH